MSKVINKLKVIQASSLVMFTKLHNYHWNIKGMQFFPLHEFTEKLYDQFAELYDDAAERILQLEGTPLVLLKDLQEQSIIKEESKTTFDAKYLLASVLSDLETFLKAFKKLSSTADEAGDATTVAFADDQVAELEKTIWMVKATLA
jgi:starvation-inducible DNA-binding protein